MAHKDSADLILDEFPEETPVGFKRTQGLVKIWIINNTEGKPGRLFRVPDTCEIYDAIVGRRSFEVHKKDHPILYGALEECRLDKDIKEKWRLSPVYMAGREPPKTVDDPRFGEPIWELMDYACDWEEGTYFLIRPQDCQLQDEWKRFPFIERTVVKPDQGDISDATVIEELPVYGEMPGSI